MLIYKSTCWPKIAIFHGCRARVSKSGICSSSGVSSQNRCSRYNLPHRNEHKGNGNLCGRGQRMSNVRKEGNVLNTIA